MRYFETVNVSEQYDIPKIVKNIFYITNDLFLKYIVLRICTIVPSHSQSIETRNHYRQSKIYQRPIKSIDSQE